MKMRRLRMTFNNTTTKGKMRILTKVRVLISKRMKMMRVKEKLRILSNI